jgi:hypothetical protein
MRIVELCPKAHHRELFTLRSVVRISELSGVYAVTNFHDEIIYIGSSKNIRSRVKQHLYSTKYEETTPMGVSYWFYYSLCDANRCFSMERGWLNHFILKEGRLPYFNKIFSP